MLYHLFSYLENQYQIPGASLFDYISFRGGVAIVISLLVSLVFGGKIIKIINEFQVHEKQRVLGLPGEQAKAKTPTMGGLIMILAIVLPCLLMGRLDNIYIQVLLGSTLWLGFVGFLDDYLKLTRGKDGLAGKYKIIGQVLLGIVVAFVMLLHEDVTVRMKESVANKYGYEILKAFAPIDINGVEITYVHAKAPLTNVPFFKENLFDYQDILWFIDLNSPLVLWIIFIPVVIFIITAVSNAANLTDGLDGLAAGTSAIIGFVLAVFAYVSGNTLLAEYLNVMYLPNTAEIVIFCGCFLGACIGFLWYNVFPAKIFMGDTGSLTLGGLIAVVAIMLRKELLIPLMCGIFVIENLSVILQVSYFKYTKRKYGEGRRIFLMSPLHHHFQKKGWHEATIVSRFWIVGILLAILTMITLKIR